VKHGLLLLFPAPKPSTDTGWHRCALCACAAGSALKQLYRGFVTAAILSAVVGGVHYSSFCSARRIARQAEDSSKGAPLDAALGAGGTAALGASSRADGSSGTQEDAAASLGASAHTEGSASANLFAAAVSALVTVVVEAPAELLRHQAQAGLPLDDIMASLKKGPAAAFTALYGGRWVTPHHRWPQVQASATGG